VVDTDDRYLDDLDPDQRNGLIKVNRDARRTLTELLSDRKGIAFLGAGVSAPLYPLWDALVDELIGLSADRLEAAIVATCRDLAAKNPDAVVEVLRTQLGGPAFRELLRQAFRPRRDPNTGNTWTSTHELVVRCSFAGVITTNYDSGVLDGH
jgi:hypothetical protein